MGAWFGLLALAKLPDAVLRKLSADVAEVLAQPEIKTRLATIGMELARQTAVEFDAFVAAKVPKSAHVIKQAGIEAH